MDSGLWLLTLFAEPWGSFQLRDVHKTNVAWSSYPFLPPTTADGLLASVAGGQRWMEGNFHKPRSLRDLEWSEGLAALGGYPLEGDYARPHFRAHVNTLMSYDGPLWAPPKGQQSAGKKPAKVTDYLCERLRFVVAGNKGGLEELWEKAIGRVSPFAKKSVLYFPYEQSPDISPLSSGEATSATESLTALPMIEMGSMPKSSHPYLMPVRSTAESKGKGYKVTWSHLNCIWEPGVKVRQGTSSFIADNGSAISKSLLEAILEE